jgi:hypothetical protein
MTYRKNAKSFTAEIDIAIKDQFKQQLKARGQTQNDAATAALKIWLSLPHEIQAIIISLETANVYEFLKEKILDVELIKELDLSGRKKQVYAALKSPKDGVFRKK